MSTSTDEVHDCAINIYTMLDTRDKVFNDCKLAVLAQQQLQLTRVAVHHHGECDRVAKLILSGSNVITGIQADLTVT